MPKRIESEPNSQKVPKSKFNLGLQNQEYQQLVDNSRLNGETVSSSLRRYIRLGLKADTFRRQNVIPRQNRMKIVFEIETIPETGDSFIWE